MSRPLRLEYPGAWYHVMNRGRRSEKIFFTDTDRERFFELVHRQEVPESKVLALDAERVITCVCEHYRITKRQLLLAKRGTENLPRDIAIYLVRQFCCKTLPSVGKEFGITNYSTVSSVVQRVKARYERDKYLLNEIKITKKKIVKSQKRT